MDRAGFMWGYPTAIGLTFVITTAGLFLIIPLLRRLKLGQYIRQDGPQSHLTKAGTPTMGGCIFMISFPVAMLLFGQGALEDPVAILMIVALGLLGFTDDYLKIRRRSSDGLTSRQKMAGQIVISLAFAYELWRLKGGRIWLPFVDRYWEIGLLIIPLAAFVIVATANGVNFTDGLDGLGAGVTFIVAFAYLLACHIRGLPQYAWLACAVAGSCLGFLCFNMHPAKVIMGDTGSLALGGAVAALALLTETVMLLPLLGVIYVSEVASVMIQVKYFERTGGKRLFRMSPIHHHFELCGWSEYKIDIVFWLVTLTAGSLFVVILV